MTENVWTSVPEGTEPAAPPEVTDHGTWHVDRGADDAVEARALAWSYHGDRITFGAWAVEADLTGRSSAFRAAFEEELARLQAEAAARREGGPS